MNYKASLKYLDSFINYEKIPPKGHAALNLKRMHYGLEAIGRPEKDFLPILIAGTVGKGSTGYFLEQILLSSKVTCGFYHSPHVDDIRERIRIQGKLLDEKVWAIALTEIDLCLKKKPIPRKLGKLTYFEILTLLAIKVFSMKGLKIGIFEVGMGGRLDATNILNAPLCILTKIDLDHCEFLGNTINKIAREKSGIIKPSSIVVSSPQSPEAAQVIKQACLKKNANLINSKPTGLLLGLKGTFQNQNAGNAITAARQLKKNFKFSITQETIQSGVKKRHWAARFDLMKHDGKSLILDAAHNVIACEELVLEINKMKKRPKVLLFSSLHDKESVKMLEVLSLLDIPIIVTSIQHARAKKLADLAAEAEAFFDKIIPAKSTEQALDILCRGLKKNDSALITGSFYLLSEARKVLKIK